jgi:RNA polymerase sigma factor (sigma-70 family)
VDPTHETVSNRELIQDCARAEPRSIEQFYERYKDLIYCAIHRWIERYGRDEDRSEDVREVFQEAIVSLMENDFRRVRKARDPERISGLVFLIAYQAAGRYFERKWKERRRRGVVDPNEPASDDLFDRISREEKRRIVACFLETLGPLERQVLELAYGDGLKYLEVASVLGISVPYVGVLIHRVKKKLRKYIHERCGSDFHVG